MKRNEDNLTDLWDNVKCPNFHIIGVPLSTLTSSGSRSRIFICSPPHLPGLDVDGIYRVSGNLAVVQKLRFLVDRGEKAVGRWSC